MNDTNNIYIFYYGGSGGFCALWILLLATDYRCVFENNIDDLDQNMQSHWNIENVNEWKSCEIWVNNSMTILSDFKKKVFLKCNPTTKDWEESSGIRVVVYTDMYTQMFFCSEKRTYRFRDISLHEQHKESGMDCTTEEFLQICINDPNKSIEYNGQLIYKPLLKTIDITQADIAITLQSIIKTNGNTILNPLGYNSTIKSTAFLKHYVRLHTDEMKKHLFKDI